MEIQLTSPEVGKIIGIKREEKGERRRYRRITVKLPDYDSPAAEETNAEKSGKGVARAG